MEIHRGGAIPSDAKTVEISQPTVQMSTGVADYSPISGMDLSVEYGPRMPLLMHGIPPINIDAWSDYPFFMLGPAAYSEDFLLRDMKHLTTAGEGIGKHSPEVRKVVAESLKHAPQLLDEYMRS